MDKAPRIANINFPVTSTGQCSTLPEKAYLRESKRSRVHSKSLNRFRYLFRSDVNDAACKQKITESTGRM